jgi:ESS family glutamate:Na+ symporter
MIEAINIDEYMMLAMSIFVLFIGMYLTLYVPLLADNYIPPAVTGGLLFSIVAWMLYEFAGFELVFDMRFRDLLLLVFFATVGLGARARALISGGRALLIMIGLAGLFLVLQNALGVLIAIMSDIRPGFGLMAGSISFAGGHGTAAAWGAEAEAAGLTSAMEVGLVFATFGLIAGGVLGGPIARYLIESNDLRGPKGGRGKPKGAAVAAISRSLAIDADPLFPVLRLLMILAVCVSLGALVNRLLDDYGLLLPGFLTAMFVAIALTNLFDAIGRPLDESLADIFGEVSLNIFLTMSMMSMQLWVVGGVLGYAAIVLLAQIALMILFAVFVVFRFMGRDYDAAVMTAGFTGLGLGATPIALANMDAVTRRYGHSLKAFIVMPIIGAFFIDILNAGVINFFIALFVRLQS